MTPPKFTSKILELAYRKLHPDEDLGEFQNPIDSLPKSLSSPLDKTAVVNKEGREKVIEGAGNIALEDLRNRRA